MLAIKRIFNQNQINLCRSLCRSLSNSKYVEVTHNNDTGISLVSLARPPVNSLNTQLLFELKNSLLEVQENKSKGVILTSALPSVFSAGLDIMEMYNSDKERLTEFWSTLQEAWITLYGLEMPVAAAINGSSPAGGCLLSLSCEYRVFVDGRYNIGLNETQLGIVAPAWFRDLYIATIGYRKAEMALLKGTLFSPKEALEIGLVDELATDKEDAIKRCQKYIESFETISRQGRAATKLELRKDKMLWMKHSREQDINYFLTLIQLPTVQAGLKRYIDMLKQRSR